MSDEDEDVYDPHLGTGDGDAASNPTVDAQSWEEYWAKSCEENARKAREAGVKEGAESERPKCRHGNELLRGVPQGVVRCFGCDEPTTTQLECCQCLEIWKQRAAVVAFDTWERSFWCSHLCYRKHWETHKHRHGPSTSAPTKLDGRSHAFEAAEGNGALWDGEKLRRYNFDDCPPIF